MNETDMTIELNSEILPKPLELGKRWQQPGNLPMEQEIAEVVAAEAEGQKVDHG